MSSLWRGNCWEDAPPCGNGCRGARRPRGRSGFRAPLSGGLAPPESPLSVIGVDVKVGGGLLLWWVCGLCAWAPSLISVLGRVVGDKMIDGVFPVWLLRPLGLSGPSVGCGGGGMAGAGCRASW